MPFDEKLTITQKDENARLVRSLKKYAFSLSSGFRKGRTNRIDITKTFYLPDPTAEPVKMPDGEIEGPDDDEATETILSLAFYAFRLLDEDGVDKPSYDFTVRASLEQNIDDAPPELLQYIEDEDIAHLTNADPSDASLIQTTTYQISQSGDAFMAVTTERKLELYGEAIYETSTAMLHHDMQPAKGTQIPALESLDGGTHQLSPTRVIHPIESVIDSSDTFDDSVKKLERELAFRAIMNSNGLDLTMAFTTTKDSAKSIRHIIHSIRTGDPGLF